MPFLASLDQRRHNPADGGDVESLDAETIAQLVGKSVWSVAERAIQAVKVLGVLDLDLCWGADGGDVEDRITRPLGPVVQGGDRSFRAEVKGCERPGLELSCIANGYSLCRKCSAKGKSLSEYRVFRNG